MSTVSNVKKSPDVQKLSRQSKNYSDIEWQTRVDLAAAYRLVHFHGWTSQVYNHITARIPGTEHLLINPFGHGYEEIRPDNLVKIDIEGNKLDDSPYPINKAGYTIHSAIHAARPDLQCVLHTHSQNATAICCLEDCLLYTSPSPRDS